MILVVCFQNLLIMKTVPMIARRAVVLTVKQVVSHVNFFFLFQSLAIPFFRLFLYEKLKVPFIPVQFLRHNELFYFVKEFFPIFLLLFYIVHNTRISRNYPVFENSPRFFPLFLVVVQLLMKININHPFLTWLKNQKVLSCTSLLNKSLKRDFKTNCNLDDFRFLNFFKSRAFRNTQIAMI